MFTGAFLAWPQGRAGTAPDLFYLLAASAQAADFDLMAGGFEAVSLGQSVKAALDGRVFDGLDRAAREAREVVMMTVKGVGEFDEALATGHHILNNAEPAKQFEGAVNAGAVDTRRMTCDNCRDGGGVSGLQILKDGQPGFGDTLAVDF